MRYGSIPFLISHLRKILFLSKSFSPLLHTSTAPLKGEEGFREIWRNKFVWVDLKSGFPGEGMERNGGEKRGVLEGKGQITSIY